MNLQDILRLKYSNLDFKKDIILQDDGEGVYIKEWNIENPKPTQQDLDKWSKEFDLAYRQKMITSQRIYPIVGDQLDMIYWDMQNGTKCWLNVIDNIKQQYPKPTE